jgi:uncharacterized protein
MKLGAAPARQSGAGENRFEHAGRDNRSRGGASHHAPAPAAQASAMASAFAKLKGL